MSIGEYLRQSRQARRLSLTDVSSALHIRVEYLEALETDAWDKLPGEVYGLGFLRSYARYLELDAEALVEYRKRLSRKEMPVAREQVRTPSLPSRRARRRAPSKRQGDLSRREARRGTSGAESRVSSGAVIGAAVILAALFVVGLYKLPKAPHHLAASSTTHVAHRTHARSVPRKTQPRPTAPAHSPSHRVVSHPASAPQVEVRLASNNLAAGQVVYTVNQTPVKVTASFTGPCWTEEWINGTTSNPYGHVFTAGQQVTLTGAQSVAFKFGTRYVDLKVNGTAVSLPDPTIHVLTITFRHIS